MRNLKTLAILAPAALALAACGGKADDETVAGTETGAEAPAPVATDFPTVPADARGTVDFAGTYEQRGADGRMSTVTLNADDTFAMTNADGAETTGTYSWYSDNSRILIKDGEANHVFAVADGAIYKMADKDAATNGTMTDEQTFRKSIALSY